MKRISIIQYLLLPIALLLSMSTYAGRLEQSATAIELSTDKCIYSPGDVVSLKAAGSLPQGARVRYYHGMSVVADEQLASSAWQWAAPAGDFTGYLAVVYVPQTDGSEVVCGTIAIDVSSSWSKFPRYGFVATYDQTKTADVIAAETALQNRWHINGIQYYDWQFLHEIPYDKNNAFHLGSFDATDHSVSWIDIAGRPVLASVVRNYITEHHKYGMNTMFYNLLFGADEGYGDRGVSWEWSLFDGHKNQDFHPMPEAWPISYIFVRDPSNTAWQNFIVERNNEVYEAFDFDGYHIDQLGYRGDRYNNKGERVDLPAAYQSFINSMKAARPDKKLVMNGVSNYGGSEIIETGKMEFSYTELWSDDDSYQEMERLVREHAGVNNAGTASVFAAYMNYDVRDEAGRYFNAPGLLLTDAAMFAVGGSHLELGDGHLLCSEYFPHKNLLMSDDLKSKLTTYYDFMTAYENYLRDGGTVVDAGVSCTNGAVNINSWPPATGRVTAYSRQLDNCKVVSLLNFSSVTDGKHLTCRDLDSDMPEPALKQNIEVKILAPAAKKVWVASPDFLAGAPQELAFEQSGDYVTLTVPSLKYWTMLVVEQDNPVVLKSAPMVVGAAVYSGWNPQNAAMMQRSDKGDNVFTYTGWFLADEEFKFLTQCDWDGDEYRNANASNPYILGDGSLQLNGNDNKFKVSESANYTVTVDLDAMSINVVKASYQEQPIYYNVLYLVGSATAGGWSLPDGTPLVQDSENPFVFTATVHLTAAAGDEFKIFTNPNSDFENQQFFYRDANDSGKISEDATGDRKWTLTAEDDYMVRVDLSASTIDLWRPITIGSLGAATYCADRQLDFSDMADIKAYIIKGTKGAGEVLGMDAENITAAPMLTGLLLTGTPGKYYVPTTERSADDCSANLLVGVTADTPINAQQAGNRNFILANGSRGLGFYWAKDGTLAANRAYLPLPVSMEAKVVLLNPDAATAISNLQSAADSEDYCYSIAGIRTKKPAKGVYVKNGKKFVVK